LNFRDGNSTLPGGAVLTSGDLSIHDATFENNNSTQPGGAVFSTSSVEVSNVTFTGNSSSQAGGAVFASTTATISNALFDSNSGTLGGAVHANVQLAITNATFDDNLGTTGGAISSNNVLDVSQSVFTLNTAQSNGGAAFSFGTGTFRDTEFTANTVLSGSGTGGAVALNGNSGLSTVEDSVFDSNSGPGNGGALRSSHALTISRSLFEDNSAYNGSGGGVMGYAAITISASTFLGNLADVAGAATGTTLSISDSTFNDNIAQIDIGAVYGNAITISGSSFDGNEAADDDAAVSSTGALVVSESSLTNNSAGHQGGALQSNGSAVITNSTIANNSGSSYIVGAFGNLQITYSTITNNTLTGNISSPQLFSGAVISLFGNVLIDDNANGQLCSGTAASSGYNFANDTSCGLSNTGDTQSATNDPRLGTLGLHGSETTTRVPLVGSALIGAIPSSACQTGGAPANDQRGFTRPNVAGGPCDIGAVQLTPMITAITDGYVVNLTISEFTSTATITLQPDMLMLGTIAVDFQGSGSGTFTIPCPIPGGAHTISATAYGGQTASVGVTLVGCAPEVVPVFTG